MADIEYIDRHSQSQHYTLLLIEMLRAAFYGHGDAELKSMVAGAYERDDINPAQASGLTSAFGLRSA